MASRLSIPFARRKPDNSVAQTAGLAPGSIVHVGQNRSHDVKLSIFSYNKQELEEAENIDLADLENYVKPGRFLWVDVDGVHNTQIVQAIGERFKLHTLVLEDIVNTQERPKYENYGDFLYFVLNMVDLDKVDGQERITMEQVSIILGKDILISFQEVPDDIFDPIRRRLRLPTARVRKLGADYLAYLLLDAVVDRYFLIMEHLGEKIDDLEIELMEHPEKNTLRKIYALKRELSEVRKSVWPLREIVATLQRENSALLSDKLEVFLRDFYDHSLRIIDTVETYRDTMASMIDLYLSNSSIKMNEIMQVLTVISTIFIPLTFITGYYGMNFENMPLLASDWGYPAIIAAMVIMVVLQIIYFKRKRWL